MVLIRIKKIILNVQCLWRVLWFVLKNKNFYQKMMLGKVGIVQTTYNSKSWTQSWTSHLQRWMLFLKLKILFGSVILLEEEFLLLETFNAPFLNKKKVVV